MAEGMEELREEEMVVWAAGIGEEVETGSGGDQQGPPQGTLREAAGCWVVAVEQLVVGMTGL